MDSPTNSVLGHCVWNTRTGLHDFRSGTQILLGSSRHLTGRLRLLSLANASVLQTLTEIDQLTFFGKVSNEKFEGSICDEA